jgi:hypothetical protein
LRLPRIAPARLEGAMASRAWLGKLCRTVDEERASFGRNERRRLCEWPREARRPLLGSGEPERCFRDIARGRAKRARCLLLLAGGGVA